MRWWHLSGVQVLIVLILAGSHAADRPNFVLILTDDQGYGDLGCFGSTTIATPNLDRIAREGARLTSFYAAAPICTPTRAALMTGCYATRVGLETPLHVYDHAGLDPEETTIGEALQNLGYRTACIGKWHLGHLPQHYPTRHGFDVYWGTPLGHMFNRPEVGRAIGDVSDLFLEGETEIPFPENGELTERITEQSIQFIADNRDRPFFLFVSHPMPHEPLAVSERFAGQSDGGLYGDVIECIDWSTGKIIDALREHGLAENTVVVFTSDNGPKKGEGSAGPLRGFKHDPYEGGVRVPCIAYAPGRIPAGLEIDSITTIMDLYPTFVRMAGGEPSEHQVIDGRDLTPLLRREPATGEPATGDAATGDAAVASGPHQEFYYFVRYGALAGIRQGQWKLLWKPDQAAELYDLDQDLGESNNLAAQHPRIVAGLQQRLRLIQDQVEQSRRGPAGQYRP